MIITNIHIITLNIPLVTPFKTALRTVDKLNDIVVIIRTNKEIYGYGETAPTQAITGATKKSIIKEINNIKDKLVGQNIDDFNKLLNIIHSNIPYNPNAVSALEIALYDIKAKDSKKPLNIYLGGIKRRFKTNITISLNNIDTMIRDSNDAIKKGFKSLKLKLGTNYKEDIQRVKEIQKSISKNITLKLDANQAWNIKQTLKFIKEIEKNSSNIDLIEQPIKAKDIKGLQYITKRSSIKIMADESVFTPNDAIYLLEKNAVDIINIKLDKCGGISKALQIADICKMYNKTCMIGCMLEGPISISAAAHVASAKKNIITMYDLDAPILCKDIPIIGDTIFENTNIILNKSYGLGIKKIKSIK
jgi:L-alanine-DL-glutamate epimerase-like enolase superfamily enzyme